MMFSLMWVEEIGIPIVMSVPGSGFVFWIIIRQAQTLS